MVACFILWKLLAFYTSCNSVKVVFYKELVKNKIVCKCLYNSGAGFTTLSLPRLTPLPTEFR
nr:MAG TPA: hypothetical protein [Caudoviricetes sp.]